MQSTAELKLNILSNVTTFSLFQKHQYQCNVQKRNVQLSLESQINTYWDVLIDLLIWRLRFGFY